jgi:cell wall assembly regulator SMI1
MSEITEALQRIEAWLQNHMTNRAAELKPGLTRDEIEEQVKDLPFSLPEVVYELYQWHDGNVDKFVFEQYDFLSLNDAIEAYHEWWAEIFYDKDSVGWVEGRNPTLLGLCWVSLSFNPTYNSTMSYEIRNKK